MRQIGSVGNHLSELERPLLYASTSCALAQGRLHDISSWLQASHAGSDGPTLGLRRDFFVGAGIVKVSARFVDGADDAYVARLQRETRREARVLGALRAAGMEAPEVHEFTEGPRE